MVRRKRAGATPKQTPGVVGPTPITAEADRADQRGGGHRLFGHSDQDKANPTKLKPVGFFGSDMPRTAILAKGPSGRGRGRREVPTVARPEDPLLAPVTIADIDEVRYADLPVSKGGAKLSARQREALGHDVARRIEDGADPVGDRAAFLLFAEDLLPGLRGKGEADDAGYDPRDEGQRAARLKVAETMWKELPKEERREYLAQAEQGRARTAELARTLGGRAHGRADADREAGSRRKPDGWHYVAPPRSRRGNPALKAGSLVDRLKEWSSDDESASEGEEDAKREEEQGRAAGGAARGKAAGKRRRGAAREEEGEQQASEQEEEDDDEEEAAPPAAKGRGRAVAKKQAAAVKPAAAKKLAAAKQAAAPKRGRKAAARRAAESDAEEDGSDEEGSEDEEAEEALRANEDESGPESSDEEGEEEESEEEESEEEEEEEEARPAKRPAKQQQQQQPAAKKAASAGRKPAPRAAAKAAPAAAPRGRRQSQQQAEEQQPPAAKGKASKAGVAETKGWESSAKAATPKGKRAGAAPKEQPSSKRTRGGGRGAADQEASSPPATRGTRGGGSVQTTPGGTRLEKDLFSATWRARRTRA